MMAGLLIISMISGSVAAAAALFMAMPIWVAFSAYAVCGMISLLALALVSSLRNGNDRSAFPSSNLSTAQARQRP